MSARRLLELFALVVVGAVFGYATLYALTPLGAPLIASCVIAAWVTLDRSAPALSCSAFALGVAFFLLFLATAVDDSLGFLVSGILVAAASIAGIVFTYRQAS